MGYDVNNMEHKEMVALVQRRLNRLAMCKRGTIETEVNKRIEALGPPPHYTKEEREKITSRLTAKVKKAMTPTLAMCKRCKDIHALARELVWKAEKVTENAYVHPDAEKHKENIKRLKDEKDQRIRLLDAEFQDVEDEYTLGIKNLTDLPADLLRLEGQEW